MSKAAQKIHPRSLAAKFPGITADAKALGVTRQHLYLVLSGQRKSARLMAAWLKHNKAAA